MVGADLEWTWETTDENSTGVVQKYEVLLKTAVVGYHSVIDVYEDTLFNSMAFVSAVGPSDVASALISGVAYDADGKPLANEMIAVRLPTGDLRRVFSNAHGIYRVFGVPDGKMRVALRGKEQEVEVRTGAPVKLDLNFVRHPIPEP